MLDTNNGELDVKASLGELADTVRDHVAGHTSELPPPAVVALYPTRRAFAVMAVGPHLAGALSQTAAWTRTLDAPKGLWFHEPDDILSIFILGHTSNGTRVMLTGHGPYSESLDLVPMPVETCQRVTLGTLDALVDQLHATSQPTEAPTWAEMTRLTDALDEHLTAQPNRLPTPIVLSLGLAKRSISIGAACPTLAMTLSILLPWTYTLRDFTITWSRNQTEYPDTIEIDIRGHIQNGTPITISSHAPYADCAGLVDLTADTTEPVSLSTLDTLRCRIERTSQS